MIDKVIHKFRTAAKMPIRDAICLIYERIVHKERWSRLFVVLRQTFYFCPPLKKRLIVYLIPGHVKVNGGVMSIFNQAEYAREYLRDAAVILSTVPQSQVLCAYNHNFPNHENVWRWGQVMRLIWRFDDVLIHIPDYFVKDFYDAISSRDRQRLAGVKKLAINIMDQNIDLMPDPQFVGRLREITPILSQTCAHTKYSGQDCANRLGLPTIYLPAYWSMDFYPTYSFDKKVRRICYSPDAHPRRSEIVQMLKREFLDFEICEIHDLTFPQFMEYVARSYAVITFGEGLDGYYSIPLGKQTMTFAVYNERFFTKEIDWRSVWNVFADYDEMAKGIVEKIKECTMDEKSYKRCLCKAICPIKFLQKDDAALRAVFRKQFHRFCAGDFDFYPKDTRPSESLLWGAQ